MRPALRYHGGKWLLAPWIISLMPAHRVYVEPYGGAASVLLRKERAYAEVYNDLDSDVVNLFQMLRNRGEELREQLRLTPFGREDFVEAWQSIDDPMESARRMVVRSYQGFGSAAPTMKLDGKPGTGFRANSNRSGTTPARDWRNYPDALPDIIDRLRGVTIENRDALEVMQAHDCVDALHYVDPPYISSTRDKGGDYKYEMTDGNHQTMAECLRSLKGMVMLSGYPCDLYDKELFADWCRIERPALADGAKPRTEVLWLNSAAASRSLSQLSMAL